jgi:hypothetical protein
MTSEDDANGSDEERTETGEQRQRRAVDVAREGGGERELRRPPRPETYRPPPGYYEQQASAFGGRGTVEYGADERQQRGWQQVPRRRSGGREPKRGRNTTESGRESTPASEGGERDEGDADESEAEGKATTDEIPKYGGPFEPDWRSRRRWGRSEAELQAYERRVDRALERQRDFQRNKSGQPYHRGRR